MSSDDGGDNDLERIIENGGEEAVETVENEGGGDEDEEKQKRIVKPKRVVKNPRPKLDAELLMGPKGLSRLERYFKNIKFQGPGHEAEDLHSVMTIYEYWCHRLCPKFTFDESLEKLEKLGAKKNVQTYIKRIRLGMEDFGMSRAEISDEEDEGAERTRVSDVTPSYPNQTSTEDERLTEEQMERMRINKERAQRLRLERLRKMHSNGDPSVSELNTLEDSTEQSVEESLVPQNTEDNSQTPSEQSDFPLSEQAAMEIE